VAAAFVSIANVLAADHALDEVHVALTEACVRILDVASAGLLLVDRQGVLEVVGASSELTFDMELLLLGCDQGPGLDCFRTGDAVVVPDLAASAHRWPNFAPVAVAAGFASVHALPLRAPDRVIGVLGLYGTRIGRLGEEDLSLARYLAQAASVTLLTGQVIEDETTRATKLRAALHSQVHIEQAKGVLAQSGSLEIDDAFTVLRRYSHDTNQSLTVLAAAVVAREVPTQVLLQHALANGLFAGAGPARTTAGPMTWAMPVNGRHRRGGAPALAPAGPEAAPVTGRHRREAAFALLPLSSDPSSADSRRVAADPSRVAPDPDRPTWAAMTADPGRPRHRRPAGRWRTIRSSRGGS
jgi:GAF domain-containing protein/ANTAR domain-containing protein